MAKKELTHQFISAFSNPEKRIEFFDTVVKGLALRVTTSGSKSFIYRYRYRGKNKRFTIGSFPAVSLADARKKTRELKVRVEQGSDPQGEKKARKRVPDITTIDNLAERFKNRHLPSLRDKTRDEYDRILDKEITPVIGDMAIEDITRKEIIDLLDKIAIDRNSPTMSNRVRAVLSSMFSFGTERAMIEENPVLNIPKRKKGESKRERTYSEKEIRVLWQAFEQQNEPVQSVFKMLLLCGQRSGETKRMKWKDVQNGIWIIPASQTKANRTHHLPLSGAAIDILERLKPLTGKSEYVFESQSSRADESPLKWLQKAVLRIRELSKVSDFRIHDLRRTAASYMAKLGTDRTVLGKVLNHKGLAGDDQVTAIYDRHDYMEEKKQALNRWSIYLKDILDSRSETKIYKI